MSEFKGRESCFSRSDLVLSLPCVSFFALSRVLFCAHPEHNLDVFCPRRSGSKSLSLTGSTVSGYTDLRTSSTLFLFEEFLPLEYRQQLSVRVQNRGTPTFFFSGSPGKINQWATKEPLTVRGVTPENADCRKCPFL